MHQPNAEISCRTKSIEIDIKNELQKLPCISKECCIYRVSKRLVNIHPTAYEPQLISIGPFHHGRQHLKPTEQFKLQFLCRYLSRIKKQLRRRQRPIQLVAEATLEWETKARKCYEDYAINMNSHDFVKMMLVDGCFIVEFLVAVYGGKRPRSQTYNVDHLIFKAMNINLYHDLIMLQNQLPFFVLQGLFKFLPKTKNSITPLKEVLHKFFQANFMKHYLNIPQNIPLENKIKHLVDFLGFYYSPPTSHIIQGNNQYLLTLPPSTTQLYEAGVIFEKASTKDYNMLNITFKDGVLKIPPFEIHGLFEISMRNLMAFENFQGNGNNNGSNNQSYAIHYVLFLEALISSEKDSNILMKKGIISNLIGGSDEEVSNMFNNIGKGVKIQGDFYYESVSKDLHKHCKARKNQWKASLRRGYFKTPWAIISLLVAIYFVLLTSLQTIFSGFNFRMVLNHP